jgi:hypothetical protein
LIDLIMINPYLSCWLWHCLVQARVPHDQRKELIERIQARTVDPYTAAEELLGDALGVVGLT